jgi:hypothetical protein
MVAGELNKLEVPELKAELKKPKVGLSGGR